MNGHIPHHHTTPSLLASPSPLLAGDMEPPVLPEANADADEPPEALEMPTLSPIATRFKRAPVSRRGSEYESLLSRALHSHSEDDAHDSGSVASMVSRRRSVTSTISLALSNPDLACDTAASTPERTASPSPRPPQAPSAATTSLDRKVGKSGGGAPAATPWLGPRKPALVVHSTELSADPAVAALQKKRCISFACDSRPKANKGDGALMPPPPNPKAEAPRRMSIKFACPSPRPAEDLSMLAAPLAARERASRRKDETPQVASAPSLGLPAPSRHQCPAPPRLSARSPVAEPAKKLVADAQDPQSESARFYAFASDDLQEDDWIRRDDPATKQKITIGDTLEKEYAIRKLGKEAEEEADLEEDSDLDEDEDEDEEPEGGDREDKDEASDDENTEEAEKELELDDQDSAYDFEDESLDGYHTDNEVGFADSEDEDDDLVLWTATGPTTAAFTRAAAQSERRRSVDACSDSSASSGYRHGTVRVRKTRPVTFRPGTPELPDSTDFVCGTLDEDRPLEEAYLSCVAARKRKMNLIPQDIDPSFPASEPEDEDEDTFQMVGDNSDDHMWLHGPLEDLHDQGERGVLGRGKASPRRCRSPPPPTTKRLHSPPPHAKARGRSPTHQPRLPAAPVHQLGLGKARTGLTSPSKLHHTELGIVFQTTALPLRPLGGAHNRPSSVPRTASMLLQLPPNHPHHHHHHHHHKGTPHRKVGRASGGAKQPNHVRGAIDIVKGLEQKRQRRKEKFYQRYCTRARKEKKAGLERERKLAPGAGVERMRQIGLLVAEKKGHYVISL